MADEGRVATRYDCQDCVATIAPNSNGRWDRWMLTRAAQAGWYFRKDGRSYCPAHRPHYAPDVSPPARGTS